MSSTHKVYIPNTAKDNQYILAEIHFSEADYAAYSDNQLCYQELSQHFFRLAEQAGLRNVHFIANDKLPVVRFHTEAFSFQTADQILFFYNPAYHEAQNSFFDASYRSRKISLLCLATGTDIRAEAASFHRQVVSVLTQFKALLPNPDIGIKIRDHQHLSYDAFARSKGCKESYGYKLRSLAARYLARGTELPADHQAMTYAAISLPLNRALKQKLLPEAHGDYRRFYQQLEQAWVDVCAPSDLTRLAFIADGTTPLVRSSQLEKAKVSAELHMLNFDTTSPRPQLNSHWHADQLVETAHLLVVAGQDDMAEMGYGRFMNKVEQSVKQLAQQFTLDPASTDLMIRFHQHISYRL